MRHFITSSAASAFDFAHNCRMIGSPRRLLSVLAPFSMALLVVVGVLASASTAMAASGTWDGGAATNVWQDAVNWTAAPFPSVNETAMFNGTGTTFATIDVGAALTIQQIAFNSGVSAAMTIGTGGANGQTLIMLPNASWNLNNGANNNLTFDTTIQLGNTSGNQNFTFNSNDSTPVVGTYTINGNIVTPTGLTGPKNLFFNGSGDFVVNGSIIEEGGAFSKITVTKNGTGTLTLAGSGNVFTNNNNMDVNAGTLKNGANEVLPNTNKFNLSSATYDVNGFTETISFGGNLIFMSGTSPLVQTGGGGLLILGGGASANVGAGPTAGTSALITGNVRLDSNMQFNVGDTNGSANEMIISANITESGGARTLTKNSSGTLLLSGTNSYTGTTFVNDGQLLFGSAASIGGAGRTIDVTNNASRSVGVNYAIDNAFLNRLKENDSETYNVTLGADSSNNLDFNTTAGAILQNARLGAAGNFTYSGTLTPNGTNYRLGGGGTTDNKGTLTMASVLSGGNTVNIYGPVNLAAANTYTGGTNLETGGVAILGSTENATVSGPFGASGNINFNGGVLQYTPGNQFNYISRFTTTSSNAYKLDPGGLDVTLASPLGASGSSGFTKVGAGTLELATGNTYTGTTRVGDGNATFAGTLRVTTAGTLPVNLVEIRNGTLLLANDVSTSFTAGQVRAADSAATIIVDRAVGGSGSNNTHTLADVNTNNQNSLTIDGYHGYGLNITSLANSGGTLKTLVDMNIGTWTSNNMILNVSGGKTVNITTLTGGGSNARIEDSNGSSGGTVNIAGGDLLTRQLSLQTDATQVNINGTLNGTNAVGVLVNNGHLGGTGTITPNVNVDGRGRINLVTGSVGTLAMSGSLNFNNNTQKYLAFDLGSGGITDHDKITVGSNITETSGANNTIVIDLNQIGGAASRITAGNHTLLDGSGTIIAAARFNVATSKAFGQTFALSTTASDLVLTTTQVAAGAASDSWTGGTTSWNTSTNWGTAATPVYNTNVTINNNANPGTNNLDNDFDINSLTFGASATSNRTIAQGTTPSGSTGMLTLENANGITVDASGGNHTISADIGIASNQTWTVNGSKTLTVSQAIRDFGAGRSLTKAGTGTLILSKNNDATNFLMYTGDTIVNEGILQVTNGAIIRGDIVINGNPDGTGATFRSTSAINGNTRPLITLNGGTLETTTGGSNHDFYLPEIIMTAGRLLQSGAAFWEFFNNGLDGSNAPMKFTTLASPSTATIDAKIVTRAGLVKGLLFTTADGAAPVDLLVNRQLAPNAGGADGGSGTVTKSGDGTMAVTFANTYSGGTIVEDGTLLVNNVSGSGVGTGSVFVRDGATLGGTGFIGGNTVIESGGHLAPGASIGMLTFNANLDISGGLSGPLGSMEFELGPGLTGDLVTLNPTFELTIGAGLLNWDDFLFTDLGIDTAGTYTLFDTSELILGTLGGTLSGTIGSYNGTISFADGGNDIVLTLTEANVIPEPSTLVLAALGLAGLGLVVWRRRRRA